MTVYLHTWYILRFQGSDKLKVTNHYICVNHNQYVQTRSKSLWGEKRGKKKKKKQLQKNQLSTLYSDH